MDVFDLIGLVLKTMVWVFQHTVWLIVGLLLLALGSVSIGVLVALVVFTYLLLTT